MAEHPNDAIIPLLYEPLTNGDGDLRIQEIRLISIVSAPDDEEVRCQVRNVAFASAAEHGFHALSYVWGDPTDTEIVWVNDLPFHATRNLAAALRQLSLSQRYAVETLWVDAICINQSDLAERSEQVKLMAPIYNCASEVLCWMGLVDEASYSAVHLIASLAQDLDMNIQSGGEDYLTVLSSRFYADAIKSLGVPCFFDTELFLSNVYWTRVWTLQEMVLASTCRIICGDRSCLLEHIESIVHWIHTGPLRDTIYSHEPPEGLSPQMWMFLTNVRAYSEQSISVMTVSAMRHLLGSQRLSADEATIRFAGLSVARRCYDPRDKLYGLAGIIDIGAEIDYKIPTERLYTSFAGSMMTKATDIKSILGYVSRQDSASGSSLGLPTWVPAWTSPANTNDGVFRANAGCPAEARLVAHIGDTRLQVSGVRLDSVKESLQVPVMIGFEDKIRSVAQFLFQCDSSTILKQILPDPPSKHLYKTGMPKTEAVLRLLSNDRNLERTPLSQRLRPPKPLLPMVLSLLADPLLSALVNEDSGNTRGRDTVGVLDSVLDPERSVPIPCRDIVQEAQASDDSHDFQELTRINPILSGASPFVTSSGYIGFAEAGLQRGDIICVLGSCSVPVVLREVSHGEHQFHSLCHVVGVMYGEVWTAMSERNAPAMVDFVII